MIRCTFCRVRLTDVEVKNNEDLCNHCADDVPLPVTSRDRATPVLPKPTPMRHRDAHDQYTEEGNRR